MGKHICQWYLRQGPGSPKYIENSHDSTPGRQTTQLKNGQRTWTDTSPRKTYRGPRDIWKDAEHHWPSERCKLKPQWGSISHQSEWPTWTNPQTNVGEDVEKREPSALLVGMQTGEATVENSMEFPQKTKNGTALWPSNPAAGIYPKNPETPIQKNLCNPVFIATQL